MRDLTPVELQAVAGGIQAMPGPRQPVIRHPLLRLLVALVFGRRTPTRPTLPPDTK